MKKLQSEKKAMGEKEKSNIRDFALLFTGQIISQLGTNMTSFALIIWIYTKSGQAMASSLLAVCGSVPYLIVSLAGALLADYVCEPFMQKSGKVQSLLSVIVGSGNGAGIGMIFVMAGLTGIFLLAILSRNKRIRELEGD